MLENRYNEMLDECYPKLEIAGYSYTTSHALKHLDPVAYREGFLCWFDMQLSDELLFEYEDGSIHDEPQDVEDPELSEPTPLNIFKRALQKDPSRED
jgi:hypothetical protein